MATDAAAALVRAERERVRRGLRDPNPGTNRFAWTRTAMASPPTVTIGAYNVGPTIAGKTFQESDPVFRYFANTAPVFESASWYKAGPNTNHWAVDFELDCQQFEVQSQASAGSAKFRIVVDGAYVSEDVTLGQTGAGGFYWYKIAFAAKAARHVVIEGDLNWKFGGVVVANADHVWRSGTPVGPRVVVQGDSHTAGTMDGTTNGVYAYAVECAKILGWRDVQTEAMGGTGFLKTNGAFPKYRDRLATEVIPPRPDVVVVVGGHNDTGAFSSAQIRAEVTLWCQQVRAALPAAALVVVSLWGTSGTATATTIGVRDAIRDGCAGYADLYVDPMGAAVAGASTLGWLTGTGSVTAPGGTGNVDAYLSLDSQHLTRAGHKHHARRLAAAIGGWIAAGCPFGATWKSDVLTRP